MMIRTFIAIAGTAAAFAVPPAAAATGGSLDPTFGAGGKVVSSVSPNPDFATDVAIQADGKIVVAGESNVDVASIVVARYNRDGTLDQSFGAEGAVLVHIGLGNLVTASAVAIQGDGRIVVAGTWFFLGGSAVTDFALVRFHPDGSLDASFDGDGLLLTDIGFLTQDVAADLAIGADGKIVAAGRSCSIFGCGFALARYRPDGSLDSSFDGDGKVVTDTEAQDDTAYAVAIQPDGKIVAAGGEGDFVIARYRPGGTLDAALRR